MAYNMWQFLNSFTQVLRVGFRILAYNMWQFVNSFTQVDIIAEGGVGYAISKAALCSFENVYVSLYDSGVQDTFLVDPFQYCEDLLDTVGA